MIFLAVLALATDEPPLSGASAQTAGIIWPCFQKITASERDDYFQGVMTTFLLLVPKRFAVLAPPSRDFLL